MRRDRAYFVYILASKRNGTLYVGVTGDLYGRIVEHRDGLVEGFTRRYDVKTLVYFEEHDDIDAAIRREKRIKRWRRAWKIQLIETGNPQWRDLWTTSPRQAPVIPEAVSNAIGSPGSSANRRSIP